MNYRLTGFNDLAKIYQVFGNQLNDFFSFIGHLGKLEPIIKNKRNELVEKEISERESNNSQLMIFMISR